MGLFERKDEQPVVMVDVFRQLVVTDANKTQSADD